MSKVQAPRGRHAPIAGPKPVELLPERVRIQAFVYDRKRKTYRALPAHSKTIVRSARELRQLWTKIDEVLSNQASWQE